jgi:hypothetical protein
VEQGTVRRVEGGGGGGVTKGSVFTAQSMRNNRFVTMANRAADTIACRRFAKPASFDVEKMRT